MPCWFPDFTFSAVSGGFQTQPCMPGILGKRQLTTTKQRHQYAAVVWIPWAAHSYQTHFCCESTPYWGKSQLCAHPQLLACEAVCLGRTCWAQTRRSGLCSTFHEDIYPLCGEKSCYTKAMLNSVLGQPPLCISNTCRDQPNGVMWHVKQTVQSLPSQQY